MDFESAIMFHDIIHNGLTKTAKAWLLCFVGKMGRFVSLETYAIEFPNRVQFINRDKERTISSLPRLDLCDNSGLRDVGLVDTFVAIIKDACCFAYSDLILLEDKVYYCEIKEDSLIGKSSNCADKKVLKADEKAYYTIEIPQEEHKLESGIFMSGLFSWNYYHFTYQVIPKLRMVDSIAPDVPLLVDKKVKEVPSFAALLTLCNKQNRPVEYLEEKVRYRVDNLYYVSGQTYLEPNHKAGLPYPAIRCRYRPSTLHYLRENMISETRQTPYPKRVFIGRKYASGRRSFNEEDCIACAKEFGFEVVFPEYMSLEEQVCLFNNAEIIIGGSGAAFTNLIYCSEGVKVIVLSKYCPTMGLWQTIIDFVGGVMVYVCETNEANDNPKNEHDAFRIDVENLRSVINELQ